MRSLGLRFVLGENFRSTKRIQQLMDNYIPDAKLNRHYGRELSFLVPREKVNSLSPLLSHLERLVKSGEANNLGFTTYGVSMTTLEEVQYFVAVCLPITSILLLF